MHITLGQLFFPAAAQSESPPSIATDLLFKGFLKDPDYPYHYEVIPEEKF